MPLNLPVFLTRTGSAIVFGTIMLLGLCWNSYSFHTLFFLVHIICLVEYGSIVEKILQTTFSRVEKMSYYFIGVATFLSISALNLIHVGNLKNEWLISFLQFSQFYFIGLLIGSVILFFSLRKNKQAIHLLTGIGYISLSFGFLVQLYHFSSFLPLFVILLIWSNDTFAYLVGSFIGKTKYVPNISPNKTLEGTIGGIIITVALAVIFFYFFTFQHFNNNIIHSIAIALIVGIAGTIGDLIESKLKRMAGIKDSGNIMPGHGGAFDRFDSLILVIPFVFLYTILFLQP
jgi:phosphatidate cytidylyltransferase